MELETNRNASVLTESASMNNSRLGLHSALLPYSPPGAVFSSSLFLTIPRKKTGLLDDLLSTCWLDAMKSSSPTHKKLTKDSSTEPTDIDIAHRNWMLKYPSALASFEKIASNAKGKKVVLFLDYDGTLSPIVDNPDQAFMSNHMRLTVKNVAKYFPTAIISGRSRDKWNMMPQYELKDQNGFLMYRKIMHIAAERDATLAERERAISERQASIDERNAIIQQRDAAMTERNNVARERDN